MSSPAPIDTYLARVDESLWLKRRARRDVIEELRGHIETLDAAARSDADALAREFGEPVMLARRIAAERPWWQTTAPWRPTVYLLTYVAMAMVLEIWVSREERYGPSTHDLLKGLINGSYIGAIAIAASAVARRMVHPLHVVLVGLRPALVFTVLVGAHLVVAQVSNPRFILWNGLTAVAMLIMSLGLAAGPALLASRAAGHGKGLWLRLAAVVACASSAYLPTIMLSSTFDGRIEASFPTLASLALGMLEFAAVGCASAWWTLRGQKRVVAHG